MNFNLNALYTWYKNALRNPKYRWWIVLGTLVYLFSPIDIAPDIIPIVGQIDDIAILTLLVSEVSQILMERLKMRSSPATAASSSNPSDTNRQAEVVDVDAVSVK